MPVVGGQIDESVPGFITWLKTPQGRVARIVTDLKAADHIGACKARWGIGRMSYSVPAGLYALGSPSADSAVLVTANYKMSYDIVRSSLSGADVWLLVLETHGVNVWCAAGRGTFSTEELINRITDCGLSRIVKHRRIIVPLLGAPGVAAHAIKSRTGFLVIYGPAQASYLKEFIANEFRLTPKMRKLSFSFYDRLVLTPVEMIIGLKTLLVLTGLIAAAYFLFTPAFTLMGLFQIFSGYIGAWLCGVVLAPVLLPWLPTRSFAVKGWALGLVFTAGWLSINGISGSLAAAALLLLPPVASFGALNFTGCTPFTSRSGVKREMRWSLPAMALSLLLGIAVLIF